MAEDKKQLLEEETRLSSKDIILKVKKLEGYIKRTERRIMSHEKKLNKLREEFKKELKLLKERIMA
jgi:hypothetical protein